MCKHGNTDIIILKQPFVGVSFIRDGVCGPVEACEPFCTHVWRTMQDGKKRILDSGSVKCFGARYVLGFEASGAISDSWLQGLCKENRARTPEDAKRMILSLSRMEDTSCIELEKDGKGDVHLAYLMPKDVMVLVQAYHMILGGSPTFTCPSLAPVCGVAAVQAYCTEKVCIAFGCCDSRLYGGIRDSEIVVGIPDKLVSPLHDAIRAILGK